MLFPLKRNNTAVSAGCNGAVCVVRQEIQHRLGDLGLSRKTEIKARRGRKVCGVQSNDGEDHSSLMQQQRLVVEGGNVR